MKTKLFNTFAIFTLAFMLSCHILKKEKLTSKSHTQKEEFQITGQRNTLSRQSQLVLIDSSHSDFTMMLWPKGKFTYSLANGFEGEADKILVKSKHTNQKMLHLKQEIKQDSASLKANYTNEKESITTVKKNKLSVGYNWGWILVLLVIIALIWVYRRFKS